MKYYFCCGRVFKPGYEHVDIIDFRNNIIADLNKDWDFIQDGTVDEILIKDGLEHLNSVEDFFYRAEKKLKVGGKLIISVPHFKAPSAYKLSHKHYFSWSYFNSIPEPHDKVKNLLPVSIKIEISNGLNFLNPIANTFPKWWEKLIYCESITAIFEKKEVVK